MAHSTDSDTRGTSPPARSSAESSTRPSVSDGILVVDKPEGMTSFAVVARVKKLLRLKKVGHCGTLDPFATGVLVLCLNQATRIADQLSGQDKAYRFTMHLGMETDTLDRTGQVLQQFDGPPCTEAELARVVGGFCGPYQQQVPRYAAVKVQGQRLYRLARNGVEVELPSRQVQIHELQLLDFQWPLASLEVRCSKGTYVRQLAADMGAALHCGAHVSELRRLASGPFGIEQAVTLQQLQQAVSNHSWQHHLISLHDALAHLPVIRVDDEKVLNRLHNGQLDSSLETKYREHFMLQRNPVRIVTGADRLLALWWPQHRREESEQRRQLRVFQ